MKTQKKETKQHITLLKSNSITFDELGKGYKAYSYARQGGTSAFNETCTQMPKETTNDFTTYGTFIETYEQLYKQTKHKSGLSINLGFFSLGHKKEKEHEIDVKAHTVIFLAKASRKAEAVDLEIGEFNTNLDDSAKSMSKKDFYTNYGAYYVNSIQTGYYIDIYVIVECNSKEEADGVKKEMELKIKSDDGSGGLNLGNSDAFADYCSKVNAEFRINHNLPPDQLEEDSLSTYKKAFGLLQLVQRLSTENCTSIVSSSLSKYPFLEDSSYAFTDTVLDKLSVVDESGTFWNMEQVADEFQKCNESLANCEIYSQYNSNFEEIPDIDKITKYYTQKIALLRTIGEKLDANPWAEDVENLVKSLNDTYSKDPVFELKPKALNIEYIYKGMVYSDNINEVTEELIEALEDLSTPHYLPKFTLDVESLDATYGSVFYATNEIAPPFTQPDAATTWKSVDLHFFPQHDEVQEVLDFLNGLTPWQYYFTSINYNSWDVDKGIWACMIFYPEI